MLNHLITGNVIIDRMRFHIQILYESNFINALKCYGIHYRFILMKLEFETNLLIEFLYLHLISDDVHLLQPRGSSSLFSQSGKLSQNF